MRIATNRATNNYLRRLEYNYSKKFQSEQKISSFRQFQYGSEAPAQAATAMRVRKAIANLNNYQENLKTADSIYSTAESSVMAISELIQSTYEKLIEAANGTHTQDQMDILADEVETFADEMCRLMNLTVADRRIFGGTENTKKAFAIETAGDYKYVTYNGVPVNQYNDPKLFPYGNPAYTDVGLGMILGEDGMVDEQSALKITFNGMEVLGCGIAATTGFVDLSSIEDGKNYKFELAIDGMDPFTIEFTGVAGGAEANRQEINKAIDAVLTNAGIPAGNIYVVASGGTSGTFINSLNGAQITVRNLGDNELKLENQGTGYSNNVIQNILDAAACIRTMKGIDIARFADQIYSLQTTVSLALADFGHTSQFIEFNQNRITNNLENLTKRQNDLESTDLAAESTMRDLLDAIYSASLQMTTQAVPQSIFDFI